MSDTRGLAAKKEIILARNTLYALIRDYFVHKGFFEVETPLMLPYSSGEPFINSVNTIYFDLYNNRYQTHLSVSPETSMKKLLAAGYEKIFTITRCFRNNENLSGFCHNPEFSMLEWYCLNSSVADIKNECRRIITAVVKALRDSLQIRYGDITLDFNNWEEMSVAAAFRRYTSVDLDKLDSWDQLIDRAEQLGYGRTDNADDAFFKIFVQDIEPEINTDHPVILTEYPSFQACFTRLKNKKYSTRFEVFCAGLELINGGEELTDPQEYQTRLAYFKHLRRQQGRQVYKDDPDYPACLDRIKAAAGAACGLDRLLMLVTNSQDIREVLLFPGRDLFAINSE
ncbi:MAG TPA: amino acid--tRNA ligase-related protein [Spirochaetota bacterium]|nr:amino acid--tRNA ligase-related protein [Spirochaetota bacterium]